MAEKRKIELLKPAFRLSFAQKWVVIWLRWYPQVKIVCTEGSVRVNFNYRWANEDARQNMKSVMADLGDSRECPEPIWGKPLDIPTPRLTRQTFEALCRRKLIEVAELQPPVRYIAGKYFYQLSDEGIKAADTFLLAKMLEICPPKYRKALNAGMAL